MRQKTRRLWPAEPSGKFSKLLRWKRPHETAVCGWPLASRNKDASPGPRASISVVGEIRFTVCSQLDATAPLLVVLILENLKPTATQALAGSSSSRPSTFHNWHHDSLDVLS